MGWRELEQPLWLQTQKPQVTELPFQPWTTDLWVGTINKLPPHLNCHIFRTVNHSPHAFPRGGHSGALGTDRRCREDPHTVSAQRTHPSPVLLPTQPSGRDASPELRATPLPVRSPQENSVCWVPHWLPCPSSPGSKPHSFPTSLLPHHPHSCRHPSLGSSRPSLDPSPLQPEPWAHGGCWSPSSAGRAGEGGAESRGRAGGPQAPHQGDISAQSGVCPRVRNVDIPEEAQVGAPRGLIHFKEPQAAAITLSYG